MNAIAAIALGSFLALLVGHASGSVSVRIGRPRWSHAGADSLSARIGRLQAWVRQSGLRITPVGLVVVSMVGALLTFGLVSAITRTPVVAVVPAVGVAVVPWSYCGRVRRARLRRVQAAWPDGLRDVLASVTAGRSLAQAVADLATTGPDALRDAFSRYPQLARMLGTVPALELLREELADATSDRVLEVVVVAHERGGAVVRDVLTDLVVDTTKDVKVLEEIETDGLEMRINTRAVLVLPWLVLVALTVRPGPFRAFYGSAAGLLVVAAGGALAGVGATWVRHLGRSMQEQRVLGAAGTRSGAV